MREVEEKRSLMSAVAKAKRCSFSRDLLFRRRQLASVMAERRPSGDASGERSLRFTPRRAAMVACVQGRPRAPVLMASERGVRARLHSFASESREIVLLGALKPLFKVCAR